MKKFKFRLQSYLSLKLAEKKNIEFELAKLLQQINKHKHQIEIEDYHINKVSTQFNTQAVSGMKASHAQAVPEIVAAKRFNIGLHEDAIVKLEKKVKTVTEALHKKEAEIKVLNNMKEESFKKFKKKIEKKQFQQMEELAQIRKSYEGENKW